MRERTRMKACILRRCSYTSGGYDSQWPAAPRWEMSTHVNTTCPKRSEKRIALPICFFFESCCWTKTWAWFCLCKYACVSRCPFRPCRALTGTWSLRMFCWTNMAMCLAMESVLAMPCVMTPNPSLFARQIPNPKEASRLTCHWCIAP